MLERDKSVLAQIIAHCDRIEEKIKDIDLSEFQNNLDVREIVSFNLFQIGELAKKLTDEFLNQYTGLPWKKIKGLRDRIVHGYGTIDFEIIWFTAKENVPEVKRYCEEIIKTDAN